MNLISQKTRFNTLDISSFRVLLILLVLCITQLSFSQSKELEKADELYNSFNYNKAIKAYKKLIEEGKHTYYCITKIAKSYSRLNNSEEAALWYKKCTEHPDLNSEIYLALAQQLLKEGKQQEASVNFHKYYRQNNQPHQLATSSFIEYYNDLHRDSSRYQVIQLAINTSYDEFGPALYRDKMVFTSNRPVKSISKRKDVQTGNSFFNLYQVDKTSTEAHPFNKALQTKFNDGPVYFSNDLQTAYITRNTSFETKQINTLDIFVATKEDESWSKDIKRLPIRKGNYTVAHAFITNDNRFIYFASDMPGGYGGMDLYVCEFKNGFLSQPRNLGNLINTSGNEIFPFVDGKDILYFASDMHPGIGGYDIFFSNLVNDKYTLPFNLGYPVNSSADDFSLILDSSNQFGFYASNRKGGKGGDDIYALRIIQPLAYCIIEANVFSEEDSIMLENAFVNIIDVETGNIMNVKTNKSGKFNCYLKKDKKYTFEVKRKFYSDFKGVLTPEQLQNYTVLKLNIGLQEK